MGTNRPKGRVWTDRKYVRNVWAWVGIVWVRKMHEYEATGYHVFTYLFIISRLDLLFYFFFIVKRHWAKWKWRYINFVVVIIIIMISVINNADYRACSHTVHDCSTFLFGWHFASEEWWAPYCCLFHALEMYSYSLSFHMTTLALFLS